MRFGFVAMIALIVTLACAPAEAADQGLLGPLWGGQSHFLQMGDLNFSKPPYDSPTESSGWIAVRNGKWYLFNRRTPQGPKPDYCPTIHYEIVVRESGDRGKTWSSPQIAAHPTSNRASDACAIVDGSSYYDSKANIWHMLTQCMAASNAGGWGLCHYTRTGPSPMGPFTADAANPVVRSGQLWSRICAGAGKACDPRTTKEEGTPDIIAKRSDYFFVTFHGWDPRHTRAYRGIAKTKDFVSFTVEAADLPGDALLAPENCRAWVEGCIGAGEATTIATGDYYYTLVETPNTSLACTKGQQWVFALLRRRIGALTSWRNGWEVYPHNPLIVPSWPGSEQKCALQYARLFVDSGTVYLIYEDFGPGRKFVARRLLKLVPGAGAAIEKSTAK